jgi:transcriptional regulator with XRE-family HTH domain
MRNTNLIERLDRRRRLLRMSHGALARLSGVSEPTVKRILRGRGGAGTFLNVAAIVNALGASLTLEEADAEELRSAQARQVAERVMRMVQGTNALESQAIDEEAYERLMDQTVHELLAGSGRKLWAE